MLGLNSYHCAEMGRNQEHNDVFPLWRAAIEAKYFGGKGKKLVTREDFDELLWRYQVCCFSSFTLQGQLTDLHPRVGSDGYPLRPVRGRAAPGLSRSQSRAHGARRRRLDQVRSGLIFRSPRLAGVVVT